MSVWNQSHNFRDRTNNTVEGWHSGFNRGPSHPNIYAVVEKMKDQQEKHEGIAQAIRNGKPATTRNKTQYRKTNEELRVLCDQLDSGLILSLEFLDRASVKVVATL